ncbi:hypothetical protein QC761_0099540 [Podospora bellae-mahoneyi]|uniref:Uncharacterized protein n=1 Tax=Podospora bellae-mahoneyi TaxID=2093777 RepID=A0ABR0FBM4_9PEZI|nr:hypothetical protein QC761_0099540 [Podospora bellae-mahoneyi]
MDQTGPSHYQRTTLVDFRLILNIAHGNFTGVSRAISFGAELYNLLILCDKYDLTALIGPWVRKWLFLFHIQHVMPVPMLPFIIWERLIQLRVELNRARMTRAFKEQSAGFHRYMLASNHSFNKGTGEVVVGVSALGARVGELLDWMAEGFYTIVKESTRDPVVPETLIGYWNYDKHWTVQWGGRFVSPEDME